VDVWWSRRPSEIYIFENIHGPKAQELSSFTAHSSVYMSGLGLYAQRVTP
jgi:hypothetical protein